MAFDVFFDVLVLWLLKDDARLEIVCVVGLTMVARVNPPLTRVRNLATSSSHYYVEQPLRCIFIP